MSDKRVCEFCEQETEHWHIVQTDIVQCDDCERYAFEESCRHYGDPRKQEQDNE